MTGGMGRSRSRRGTPAESRDCQCQSLTCQPTQRQVLTTSNINSYSLLVTLMVSILSIL